MITTLGQSLRDCRSNTHIMVTTRPEADIELLSRWAPNVKSINLGNDSVDQDIHGYIGAMVTQMCRWKERPDIQEAIKNVLIKQADGI